MSYEWRDQVAIIKAISLDEGERKTLDCPFCGGQRKFSICKIDGKVLWNCYKASCTAKGSYQGQRSVGAIRRKLDNEPVIPTPRKLTPLPSITGSPMNNSEALAYLDANNCLPAYRAGLIPIRYAPAEKRVLFYTANGLGAVGRSLAGHKAKWWTYGDVSGGYVIGSGGTAVIVEDVPSACSVARLPGVAGIPLLGTGTGNLPTVAPFDRVIIILDNDAASKSLKLTKVVGRGATVRLSKVDLKHLTLEKLDDLLRN